MVDIEIFDDQELQPFALRRYAKWMPMTINRRSVFRMLDLEDQYQKREAHCHLWHNHLSVWSDQTSPLQLEDGDYIQVHIGDEPPSLSCVSDRDLASMNNSNHSSHSADLSMDQEVATLFQLTMYKTEQVWSQFQTWLQTDTWRIAPQHERTGQPIGSHPQGGPLPPQRAFNAHLHFDDRRLFARIFETTSIIECEDEGPIAYLETWYIHHQTHRSCTESRSVRISHDSPSWIEDIVEPWATTIDPALEVTIHLVKPQPPRTNMECIMAHLILEQSSRLEHTVGMISTATSQTPRSQFHHSAHSLPDIMNQAYVLRQAGLHEVCRDGRCRVRLGNIPFGLFDWDDFPRASSLTIHREQFSFSSHATSHEVLDLMQRTAIRWRRRSTDQHGSSAQQPGGGCTNFTFNPHARPFDPATPHIASVPENVQELHQLWSRTAFSWQGEEASTIVMTWLVDQYHPGLRTCLQPRPVRLYSDFRQWTMQLRSVWPDRAITGAPIMLHVVTPQPPNLHPNVAAHVILVQNPQDSLSSALFTGFDGSLPQPGPFMQLVATTHEHFRLDQLLVFIGLGGRCIFPGATMICRAWYDLFQIHIDRPFPLRDGHGIVIHLSLRPTQPQTGVGNSLLQRGHQAITKVNLTHFDQESAPCERQTADTVAHDQRPQDRLEIFPQVGEHRPQDWVDPQQRTIIQVVYAYWNTTTIVPPKFLELHSVYSAEDVEQELSSWGFQYKIFLCGEHDTVFAPPLHDHMRDYIYVYCAADHTLSEPVFVHITDNEFHEQQHMRYLHSKGYHKAVIMQNETWMEKVQCVHFLDVQPDQAEIPRDLRTRTPWPSRQTQRPTSTTLIKPEVAAQFEQSTCHIQFDIQELCEFMDASNDILWTDYSLFDLPEFIKLALDRCQTVQRVDRYVIFTDGSSQAVHRHSPPLWIADNDVSDSWAFAVFAEQYSDDDTADPILEFLGWTCQQVLYDIEAAHSIGTTRIGSDSAETEALFWAGMWRLSRNNNVPTVFVSDSRLIGDQAAGRCGSAIRDQPYYHLRAVFQALEAGLDREGLMIAHVRSHTGDPYNELVDWLAKREPHQSQFLPRQQVNMQSFTSILRHLWMAVAGTADLPHVNKDGFSISPCALPLQTVPKAPEAANAQVFTRYTISCGTANVRTFYRGEQGHPGKLQYVREQFRVSGLHFIGLQEARTDPGTSLQDKIYRLASGHDGGHLGVEIWINLMQPYAHQGQRPKYFQRSDFVVVDRSPRHLLVHVVNEDMRFWILCAHSPHSGIPSGERETWWHTLSETVHRHAQQAPTVVLMDANARSGPADHIHVFVNDDVANNNTAFFREFLEAHQLCAPSTLSLHEGHQTTWMHPSEEAEYRIDYVLVPLNWASDCTQSCSLDQLDMGHLGDHRAMAIELSWQGASRKMCQKQQIKSYDRTSILTADLAKGLDDYAPLPWQVDIEHQVDHFNKHVLAVLHQQCPARRHGPKKSFISEHIWQLRAQKLRLQRAAKDNKKRQQQESMTRIFMRWAGRLDDDRHVQSVQFGNSLAVHGLKTRIELYVVSRQLRCELTTAKRVHVKEIITALPPDCAASTILNTLKPVIGPTNPKLRRVSPLPLILNEHGQPCTTPTELTNCWADFFGTMEGGHRVSASELRNDWIKDLGTFMQQDLALRPEDVPTLTDLEHAFRRVRPHKAVGDDQVPPEICHRHPVQMARLTFTQMLKLCTHGQEALQHKGGLLVAAWKRKGPQKLCSSYRSLLISSHVGKTVHRAIRDHQANVYEAFLQHQQVGGRRHFPVTMGVHYLRSTARMARQTKRSHAMIFLDLQEAFYRVIRPIAIGGVITDTLLSSIADRLRLPPDAVRDLYHLLQLPAATEMAGLPPHLARALQALHTNTHFRVHGQTDATHTRVGTRPGDPFADVVFGYMFARLLTTVEQKMQELDILETIHDVGTPGLFPDLHAAPLQQHSILGPTWMDDLCITVTSSTAHGVENKAGLAASVLLETCMNHGVTPNLQKGKTEILLSFRGQGSRALKQKYFSPQQGQRMMILTEYGTHYISVVGDYTHLGGLTHHTGTSRKEMRRRIAIGNNAFNLHRKLLFQNQALSADKRTQLFMTLVTSKISYGTESWILDDVRSKTYFNGAILRLYRRLMKCPPDSAIQDDEILVQTQLPAPEDLLRISRLRYVGLLYRCEDITPWALIRADTQWMHQIKLDFQWLWIEHTTKLSNPEEHFPAWEYVLRYHRSYWKTLLQRGTQLSQLHRQDDLLLRRLHHDVLGHLAHWGPLQFAPVRPNIPIEHQTGYYGCMSCGIRCKSKAGEGVHLFKVHGICARERHWITHTGCEVCLKEYHSFDKLQAHLRRSDPCRAQLCTRAMPAQIMPGIGSKDNALLKAQHDDLLPVQQAAGPRPFLKPPGEIDLHHVPLFEQLILLILDSPALAPEDLQQQMRDCIRTHDISWTHTQLTIRHVHQAILMIEEYDAATPQVTVFTTLEHLLEPSTWGFLNEIQYETAGTDHLHHLDLYEQWCCDLAAAPSPWKPTLSCPRPVFRERVVLHAYSGRRRPGDFQWFLDALGRQQKLEGFYVVSLDIVIDSTWGDIGNQKTQRFWLESMRAGFVIGFLSGPPCCTWSVARGKQVAGSHRRGPRVLRTVSALWGYHSVSLKEKRQLLDGHLLLGFSLKAMVVLSTVESCGALEHPAEPADDQAASIWRLPIVQMITTLPGFRHYEFAQGLLGADSAKRTGLLSLNLPDLPKFLRANAVCAHVPRAHTIGIDEQGQFRTAKLKEYPPALCKALAEGFFSHFPSSEEVMKAPSLPTDFVERCKQMTCSAMGTRIGADYVGG